MRYVRVFPTMMAMLVIGPMVSGWTGRLFAQRPESYPRPVAVQRSVPVSVAQRDWMLADTRQADTPQPERQSTPVPTPVSASRPTPLVAPQRTISIDMRDTPRDVVLREIARRADIELYYTRDVVPPTPRISIHVTNVSVDAALRAALTGLPVKIRRSSTGAIAIVPNGQAAMVATVTGVVTDAKSKRPLPGAQVTVVGGRHGTTTDDAGRYTLRGIPAGEHTIAFRLIGYERATRRVTVADGESITVNVSLDASASVLDQVVVTGTVVATAQKAVPNAMSVITAKEIEQRGITHIDQLFRGDVPGVFAQNTGSGPADDAVQMFARGGASLNVVGGIIPMKTYINGVEMANSAYLNNIDPKSIERVEIITGPQAATLYGSGAVGGVMQIFTKMGSESQTRPRLTLSLLSGQVQNRFSDALAPTHDHSLQADGGTTGFSYNIGTSYQYYGQYIPGRTTEIKSLFGGIRHVAGPVTADATARFARRDVSGQGLATSSSEWYNADRRARGLETYQAFALVPGKIAYAVNQRTFGLNISANPTAWWQNRLVLGQDVNGQNTYQNSRIYRVPSDTLFLLAVGGATRTSGSFTSTAHAVLSDAVQFNVIVGADEWKYNYDRTSGSYVNKLGTLTSTSTPTVSRDKTFNKGAFGQIQTGLWDQVFITAGLRVEDNPRFGSSYGYAYTPRVGLSVTREFGPLSAKARVSYGKASNPPASGLREQVNSFSTDFGDYVSQRAAPELAPEFSHGGEGGIELYYARRWSLVVTRYNQIVDGLISLVPVDSAQSLQPDPNSGLYAYARVYQAQNLGVIRNQGWELQGTTTVGPVSAKGTYTYMKSRVLALAPGYTGGNQPGGKLTPGESIQNMPEHTWGGTITYARGGTTIGGSLSGIGSMLLRSDNNFNFILFSRLPVMEPWVQRPPLVRIKTGQYTTIDLNGSQVLNRKATVFVRVVNANNVYRNDYASVFATMGRQTLGGLRVTF